MLQDLIPNPKVQVNVQQTSFSHDPDPGDNHGTAGENVAFTDRHVEWVSQKNYLRSWFRGNDEVHASIK
jgi:hypothetical protein